ncbi:MAG: photosynthetic complex putative assembly protein PuhB [Steroidobacteraceae bacterium]
MSHDDFNLEPVHGLPAALPAGERLLWQGSPRWRSLAVRALHVRKVGVYFVVLALWSGSSALSDGAAAGAALLAAATQIALGGAAIGLLAGIAWLAARATVYSVTSERVVIRFGTALPMTVNLPFSSIESALLRQHADGTGDLPLVLTPTEKVSYLLMWPHVRPWQYRRVQPMIRGVADAHHAAAVLADAMRASLERRQAADAGEQTRAEERVDGFAPPVRIVRTDNASTPLDLGPVVRA